MKPVTPEVVDQQVRWERARIEAAAQALFLERGAADVALADVAFVLRMPLAAIERNFPQGKPALLRAVLGNHLAFIHQELRRQRETCGSAVEELLAMRRFLHQQMSDTRSLLFQELETQYPVLWRYGRRIRTVFMLDYLRANLHRGQHEGFYHADLDVEARVRQWLRQSDSHLRAVRTASELLETHYAQLSQLLASLTTPVGAYVARRLQEAPPYY